MLFFTKKIVISKHAKERYKERVLKSQASDSYIRKAILQDFTVKAIRRKTVKDEKGEFKLWCFGARLYVCLETEKTILIKTVVQMLPQDEKRLLK